MSPDIPFGIFVQVMWLMTSNWSVTAFSDHVIFPNKGTVTELWAPHPNLGVWARLSVFWASWLATGGYPSTGRGRFPGWLSLSHGSSCLNKASVFLHYFWERGPSCVLQRCVLDDCDPQNSHQNVRDFWSFTRVWLWDSGRVLSAFSYSYTSGGTFEMVCT